MIYSFLLLSLFFSLAFSEICPGNLFLAGTCCPSESNLVLTCSNLICETEYGENSLNCPFDCGDPTKKPISWTQFTATCPSSTVFYPLNIKEVKTNLKNTIKNNQELRVWGAGHSICSELCSDGAYMVLNNLNEIIGIEEYNGEEIVNVQAGVTFLALNEFLFNNSKSLGYAIPGYSQITVGGFVANGGRGSNAGVEGASIISLVRSIDKMDQRGRVHTYEKSCTSHEKWKALMADQGLIGITVSLKLKIRNAFNIKSRILAYTNEEIFRQGGMKAIADECQNYMFFNWFRSYQQAFVTCGTETDEAVTSTDTWNRWFVPFISPDQLVPLMKNVQKGACDSSMDYFLESQRGFASSLRNWIEYTSDGVIVDTSEGIGYSHKMLEVAPQDYFKNGIPGIIPVRMFSVSIPESMIDDALAYVKIVLDENNISFIFVGLNVLVDRYNDDSWLGISSVGNDSSLIGERVYSIEAERFYPYGFTAEQEKAYDSALLELFKYLVENFKGRLHTGKNMEEIWSSNEVKNRYSYDVANYQEIVEDFDPFGVFSNKLAADLGISWPHKNEDMKRFYYYN